MHSLLSAPCVWPDRYAMFIVHTNQVDEVLIVKCHIAAATYWVTLTHVRCSLNFTTSWEMFPSKPSLFLGTQALTWCMVPWFHPNAWRKWHLDRFSRFCRARTQAMLQLQQQAASGTGAATRPIHCHRRRSGNFINEQTEKQRSKLTEFSFHPQLSMCRYFKCWHVNTFVHIIRVLITQDSTVAVCIWQQHKNSC